MLSIFFEGMIFIYMLHGSKPDLLPQSHIFNQGLNFFKPVLRRIFNQKTCDTIVNDFIVGWVI